MCVETYSFPIKSLWTERKGRERSKNAVMLFHYQHCMNLDKKFHKETKLYWKKRMPRSVVITFLTGLIKLDDAMMNKRITSDKETKKKMR